MTDYIVEIENLTKSYGDKLILDDIDLRIRAGEFCSVVGPSGCGKSTLLRLILGQEVESSGTLLIEGQKILKPDPSRGIVYQHYSLFPQLTVLENVLLGKRLSNNYFSWRAEKKLAVDEATYILEKMRLKDALKKYPHELSGGMQQRVAIAQALLMKPKILLMDEPFGALDPGTREDINLHLLELWEKEKMTVFMVTHDLEEAVFLGTRVLVLSMFFTKGKNELINNQHGARIVSDLQIKKDAVSTNIKSSAHFRELIEQIKKDGFEPAYKQHIENFNMNHPDAWIS